MDEFQTFLKKGNDALRSVSHQVFLHNTSFYGNKNRSKDIINFNEVDIFLQKRYVLDLHKELVRELALFRLRLMILELFLLFSDRSKP